MRELNPPHFCSLKSNGGRFYFAEVYLLLGLQTVPSNSVAEFFDVRFAARAQSANILYLRKEISLRCTVLFIGFSPACIYYYFVFS